MKRKIVQTGSSLAVTLPRDVVEQFHLSKGDEVEVSVHPQNGAIVVRTAVQYFDDGKVTKKFERLAKDLITRRAKLYRELAK
jgi:antitoxin component of MazEF toxin-antitoxin module